MTKTVPCAVRLLIVDNSPTARERLRRAFESVPNIEVVGEAGTVERALRLFEEVSPSAVLMDCGLPMPGSFAAVHEMMTLYPVPVIMMTKQPAEPESTLEAEALETGAVALVTCTPTKPSAPDDKTGDNHLIRTVRAMSEVKVVRRRGHLNRERQTVSATRTPAEVVEADPTEAATSAPNSARSRASAAPPEVPADTDQTPGPAVSSGRIEIVAIGASTGGPPVLQTILRGISQPLPVPIVLVQHLSRGFQSSLVAWLTDTTRLHIVVGEHGMPLSAGVVYLAPDDRHMSLDASKRISLSDEPPENGSRPSVSALFRSVAHRYGPHAIGVLLTGMGRDGAKELKIMRDKGAVTIAQDEETSVVHGMPGEAIKLKGARYILAPERVASVIGHHVLGSRNDLSTAACR